jgi:hypothetical protein
MPDYVSIRFTQEAVVELRTPTEGGDPLAGFGDFLAGCSARLAGLENEPVRPFYEHWIGRLALCWGFVLGLFDSFSNEATLFRYPFVNRHVRSSLLQDPPWVRFTSCEPLATKEPTEPWELKVESAR